MNELKGYMYVPQRHSSLKPKMLLLFSINALCHVLIQQNLTFKLIFYVFINNCFQTTKQNFHIFSITKNRYGSKKKGSNGLCIREMYLPRLRVFSKFNMKFNLATLFSYS